MDSNMRIHMYIFTFILILILFGLSIGCKSLDNNKHELYSVQIQNIEKVYYCKTYAILRNYKEDTDTLILSSGPDVKEVIIKKPLDETSKSVHIEKVKMTTAQALTALRTTFRE